MNAATLLASSGLPILWAVIATAYMHVKHMATRAHDPLIKKIIEALCGQFIENKFEFGESGIHPFIYYKFLITLEIWRNELDDKLKRDLNQKLKDNFGSVMLEKYKDEKPEEAFYSWFLDTIYDAGK